MDARKESNATRCDGCSGCSRSAWSRGSPRWIFCDETERTGGSGCALLRKDRWIAGSRDVPFISIQTFVMSTASICGTAGLPLPCEEREQTVLAAYPWLHSTETCF